MKVVITGAGGQLAAALTATAGPGIDCAMLGRSECDLADDRAIVEAIAVEAPDAIINCAAYTAVDRAEQDAALALRINGGAVATLARVAAGRGAKLIQISTDFVFDGLSSRPYRVADAPNPLGVYGAGKLMGERAALENHDALVVRTAWVYGAGGRNFVETMLRLMGERAEIAVVDDQVGTPTHALSLAQAIWSLISVDSCGIRHFTDAGVCSWYDFAVAIHEEALAFGLPLHDVTIRPISSDNYPQLARRPPYSVLDKSATWHELGWESGHWRAELRKMLLHREETNLG